MKKLLLAVIFVSAIFLSAQPQPPVAPQIPHQYQLHGLTISDEYHWLKDKSRSNPQVLEYLDSENKYTDLMMQGTQSLQDSLYQEFRSRIPDTDSSVPYKMGSYWYYSREEEGLQYSLYCRKKNNLQAPEEIYLDQNLLAQNREYLYLNGLSVSPKENLLAYLADFDGSEICTLYIKDISSGKLLPDSLYNVDDVCWANDNKTLYYCTLDQSGRTDRVWRHQLGTPFLEDELLFHETDPSFYTYVYKSKSRRFIIIGTSSKTSSEIRILSADEPQAQPLLVEPRRQDIEYYLTHHEDSFLVTTNEDAPDFKIMITPQSQPQRKYWQEFIPPRPNLSFNTSITRDFLILKETYNYQDKIRIISFDNKQDYYISAPDSTARLSLSYLPDYESPVFRFYTESMQSPWKIFEYNLENREKNLIKEQKVFDFDPDKYHSQRLYATAEDGEKVPISLVYRRDKFSRDAAHPLFLTAYGAYGDNSDPYFSTTKLSLLDRGYCWAIAHVRGGGEMGKRWYEAGKMNNKMNTFTDLIACAQFLIDNKYTSPQCLAVEGASAGGLLIGAVANMRPDLFQVVIGDVPFVDLINTMLDPSLSATVSEYEEWGNPNIKEQFLDMYAYCPYSNIKTQDYPNILLLAGFYDPRVNYWEPAKLCARLRTHKTDDNILLLKVNDAGHSGASGRYDYLREIAFEYAFIIDRIRATQ